MIQVINRALDILEYIAREPDKPKVLGEIAGELGLNAGTCANIIKTLVERKYVEKLDKQKGYCLGPMAYDVTGNAGYKKGMVDAAKEEMEALTKKINENSLLCILNKDIRTVIYRVQSTNDLQANTSTEKRAYNSASGRLLVAMLPDEELEKFIANYSLPTPDEWDGVTSKDSFLKQVKKVRSEGYAIQVTKNQIIGLAVAIYKKDTVIASLSIYMPVFRVTDSTKPDILKKLKLAAARISKKIS